MKRLISIAVFVVGSLAAELAHPVHCMLIGARPVRVKLRAV